MSDPGWKNVGSGINISDPQHWVRIYRTFNGDLEVNPEKGLGHCGWRELELDGGVESLGAGGVVDQPDPGSRDPDRFAHHLGLSQDGGLRNVPAPDDGHTEFTA
jgi:hypothetical protein